MVEYNNTGFGEMYQSLFLPKKTGTDWRSAFRQQEELLKKAESNVTLSEINNSPLKESKLGKVGTILNDIKKDQRHIREKRQHG
ncbi:hypothetical protein HET73_01550 [Wolbachia endosymbiont of Atemnus politus]|uniref:hypothetical protein n=1 Tax=Wolbachia endosymbiont of Atemnus politus TaxID=2682840 RepID=UPI0015721671|nr:hypothetical protein [Wolbachia endosymbiont of Atemnus politus]NSM56307.1 hypothetical protein [Wolbachia endosymbiont of Atemnus politus]NSX83002.1 hypothetical protein [Wolbachia endosymbiont of Atemnus politus]